MGSIQQQEILGKNGKIISSDAIEELKASLKGKIVLKSESQEYKDAIHRWNEVYITEAAIVAMVENEQDISVCILWVQKNDVDLAIAGARHTFHGASSSEGLVIDLRKMRKVTIDKQNMRVIAEGGCLAEDLEVPAYAEGLGVVMGAVNETGIGGLSLGGGTGMLSGEHGHVVDNILSVRLVTADGQVRVCNKDTNADLFWGIRGGGSNFGVVAEFTYQAHPQGEVFFGVLGFAPDKVNEVFSQSTELYEKSIVPSGGKFAIYPAYITPPGAPGLMPICVVFFNGSEAEGRKWAKPVLELGPLMDTCKVMPFPDTTSVHKNFVLPGINRATCTVTQFALPIDFPVLELLLEDFAACADKYGTAATGSRVIVELRNHKVTEAVPADATAYGSRHEAINVAIDMAYADPKLDVELRNALKEIVQKARERAAANKGTSAPDVWVNANYSSGGEKIKNVFGSNLGRLSELKKKYDPNMVFNKWYPISPAA